MTDKAAIRADFVKPNPVPSRKVLQLVFEVPEEQADHAMEVLGGYPQSGQNRWCAIALLKPGTKADDETSTADDETPVASETIAHSPKGKRPWDQLSPSVQAGIRCCDRDFHHWLGVTDEEEATTAVRRHCFGSIRSRADLDKPEFSSAAARWYEMDLEFRRSQQGRSDEDLRAQARLGP